MTAPVLETLTEIRKALSAARAAAGVRLPEIVRRSGVGKSTISKLTSPTAIAPEKLYDLNVGLFHLIAVADALGFRVVVETKAGVAPVEAPEAPVEEEKNETPAAPAEWGDLPEFI